MNKMGFGFLRLPGADPKTGEGIDFALLDRMVDDFLARGGRYFDTARPYLAGRSEEAIRRCLVERHPRDSFHLANKITGWVAKTAKDCDPFFHAQLEACGVDWFDTYLIHSLNGEYYDLAQKAGHFDFLRRKKEAGQARRIGFSFHGDAVLLDRILTEQPDVDVVQLQINYLDWESKGIQSRRCYEVARSRGKPIVVMEPVKGGNLAKVPDHVAALLAEAAPGRSPASWAVRFAQSLEGVETVLSGMNSLSQIADNLAPVEPLTGEELGTLSTAAAMIRAEKTIGCTGCGYCLAKCPKDIPIPQYFALFNEYKANPKDLWRMHSGYLRHTEDKGRAAECIGCGACQHACPQHLPIPDHMKEVSAVFDREDI